MNIKRLTLSSLFAAAPFLMLLAAAPTGCILNEDFLKEPGQFTCTDTSDCSEPGFTCRSGLCQLVGVSPECIAGQGQDADGDGYGTDPDDRSMCDFPALDFDDTCEDCFPGADEVCDGKDNDGNGETDEPVPCPSGTITDCPLGASLPAGSQWKCEANACILVPQMRATPECQNVTLPCVGGAYDNTEAVANGCITQ